MRARILETTDRLFYRQGIRAIGVDTVAAEIGISKRTLYNYFPSKDALVVAYLERRFAPLPESDQPPAEQILDAYDRVGKLFDIGALRGCPFVNAVTELADPTHEAARIAIAFKERRRLWFRDLLTKAKAKDADSLAGQLQVLLDGAIIQMLVRNDAGMAAVARRAAETLLAAAGVKLGLKRPSASAPRPSRRR
ncbi:MAG: TetR/AcrR family transcriptional regulator [Alphaproteobacteria bacterium]|nr:TetR/AcrR family transcriptional regulator [Alphaproteobacteria bacterium]